MRRLVIVLTLALAAPTAIAQSVPACDTAQGTCCCTMSNGLQCCGQSVACGSGAVSGCACGGLTLGG